MLNERCAKCGHKRFAHSPGGACPTGLTVTLTVDTIERFKSTGHPRLIGMVLGAPDAKRKAFAGIEITALRVDQSAVAGSEVLS